jgi:four helix bundle protein
LEAKTTEISDVKHSTEVRTLRGIEIRRQNMGKYVFPFEKLEVWRLSVDLAEFILGLLETLPPNRFLRLTGQLEAAVVSPGQNIAEGKGRQYKKEFIQYLHIAQGSLYEVLTLTEVFRRRGLFTESDSEEIRNRCEVIDRKLDGLVNSLRGTVGRSAARC